MSNDLKEIDLTQIQRKIVDELLKQYLPNTEVWAYGSRAKFTSKPQSDLDMVAFATHENKASISKLKEAFEESSLPFRVDLFVWDEVPAQFHKNIKRDKVILQKKSSLQNWDMKSEWSTKLLGEIVKIKGGKRLPAGEILQKIPNSHPYIRVRDMGQRYIPRTGIEYVPDTVFLKIRKYIVEENDLIISIVGTIGLVSLIDNFYNNASQTENCAKLTGLKIDDALYIYYYLISTLGQKQIQKYTVGAVQLKLPLYNIAKLSLPWPNPEIRLSITNVLNVIDEKILYNNITNQTLEEIAQAMFKSWFVDFDPVKAKAEGRKPVGMDEATAALFPDSFEESELGTIPKGWAVKKLSDVINLIGGGTPSRSHKNYWDGNIAWFSIKDTPADSDIFVLSTNEKITTEGLSKSSTKILRVGTTIITARGTVGKLALVGKEMAMNQSCYGVTPKEPLGDFYNFYQLKNTIQVLQQNVHGAVFDTITSKTFNTVRSIIPTSEIANAFEIKIKSLMNIIKLNLLEIESLSNIRDTLLPKLLSGEISVSEIEEDVMA